MYKTLTIGEQDYKLEYSVEASLYADCISSITGIMSDIGIAGKKNDIKKALSGMSNIPQTALTIFYAGLMEAHGTHPDGDGTVPDIQTAKRLIAQYIKEHTDDDTGNFYGVMQLCIEQMGEDNFFKLTGVEPMMSAMAEEVEETEEKPKKQPKIPQDHKKATKK